MSIHFIELAKFFFSVIPCVWFLRKEISEIVRRLDVLETRLDGKIDNKFQFLEQEVQRIESSCSHVAARQQDHNERFQKSIDEIKVDVDKLKFKRHEEHRA